MTARLAGKVAIVTGGASGMGLATVRRFLDEGASVVFADVNRQTGEAVQKELRLAGFVDRTSFRPTDVTSESEVADLVSFTAEKFGALNVMFNNAGIGGAFGPVTDMRLEDWEYTFRVLVHSVFLGIKHSARQMQAQGRGGSIINTGSIAGVLGGNGPLCYSSAKAAVNHLTRAAAVELAVHQIRVNNILPGPIRTPLMLGSNAAERERAVREFIPLGRLGEPSDIGSAALFYASDDSQFITGDSMTVDGGLLASSPGMVAHRTLDAGARGPSGVNHGSTGKKTTVHSS